jgi:two-component system, sporulation sensor kinase B
MPSQTEFDQTPRFNTPDLISWLHDAANLIRNIDLCTHLLASPDLDARTRRRIHQSAVRTIAVLKDMFPSLRRPARRGQRVAVCELGEAVDSCIDLLRPQARIAKVSIEVVRAPDLLFVAGERGTYQRLVQNLVLNALAASASGGHVTVKLKGMDSNAILVVADNGSGMPLSVRRRLFKEPITTKPKGSGRGLLHAAATVATLGGTIAVASRLRKGTMITLRFPLRPVPKDVRRVRRPR